MTAQVLTFPTQPKSRPQPAAKCFRDWSEVLAFPFPDPVYVSKDLCESEFGPADRQALLEFFAWFGVVVDVSGCAQSLAAGWEYLGAEVGTALSFRRLHPQTFEALYGGWTSTQLAYLDAVENADFVAAAARIRETGMLHRLGEKMRTQQGCALMNI